MILIRLFFNLLVLVVELACVVGIAWLLWRQPLVFAALTAGLALVLGLRLELLRLAHELPFYFDRIGRFGFALRMLVGGSEAAFRALVAGGVALITFSGTNPERLKIVAVVVGAMIFFASAALRRLTLSFGVKPARWGYFRMAVPLGLAFSIAMSFFPAPSTASLAWATIDLPQKPSIEKVGELLFNARLWIDGLIYNLIAGAIGPEAGRIAALLVNSNVLTGFVLAVHAVALSEISRVIEETGWRLTGRG
jgi:hypothetical protein